MQAIDLSEQKAFIPSLVEGGAIQGVVKGYSRWRGVVTLAGDVLVPRGAVLVIDPGTLIKVATPPSSRTDPEFLGNETEVLIEGRLEARGGEGRIVFAALEPGARWYGLVFKGEGASAGTLEGVEILDAEQGITLLDASPVIKGVTVERGSYGLLVLGSSRPKVSGLRLADLSYGVVGGGVDAAFQGLSERFFVAVPSRSPEPPPPVKGVTSSGAAPTRYLGRDRTHFIVKDTTWQGRVIVDGTVQVVGGATLTVLPGTRVEFTPYDFDGDGIGDSQIVVSGGVRILGEADRQVLFTSLGKGRAGSWGMVSLLASDREDNLVRFARFENAYRGFHNHFSNCLIEDTVFVGNLRGLQFQEAEMDLRRCWIGSNLSGIRCRDSRLVLEETVIDGNAVAASVLRSRGRITACRISGNMLEGLWIRESEELTLETTTIQANRRGVRSRDSVMDLVGCAILQNAENGLSFQGGVASVTGSVLGFNGLDGISVENAEVTLRGNDILGNGEYAVDNQGTTDILSIGTWWGGDPPVVRERGVGAATGSLKRQDDASEANAPRRGKPSGR